MDFLVILYIILSYGFRLSSYTPSNNLIKIIVQQIVFPDSLLLKNIMPWYVYTECVCVFRAR